MFYPRCAPSMIVNNIPSLTVVQMAAFQFGDRPVWVETCRSPGMCSDTTCPIKSKFLHLIPSDSLKSSHQTIAAEQLGNTGIRLRDPLISSEPHDHKLAKPSFSSHVLPKLLSSPINT